MMRTSVAFIVAALVVDAQTSFGQTQCLNNAVSLICPAGSYIKVLEAVYGGSKNMTCGVLNTLNCSTDMSTRLQTVCKSNWCRIRNGPPYVDTSECASPYHYLNVSYTCVGDPMTNSPTVGVIMPPTNPTRMPTPQPSTSPTTLVPPTQSKAPTRRPTREPTENTSTPTQLPTGAPTRRPTFQPTKRPTMLPTGSPTPEPTFAPTKEPTQYPTYVSTQLTKCMGEGCELTVQANGGPFNHIVINTVVPRGSYAVTHINGIQRSDGGFDYITFYAHTKNSARNVALFAFTDEEYEYFQTAPECKWQMEQGLFASVVKCKYTFMNMGNKRITMSSIPAPRLHFVVVATEADTTLCLQHAHTEGSDNELTCSSSEVRRLGDTYSLYATTNVLTPTNYVVTEQPTQFPTVLPTKQPTQSPTTKAPTTAQVPTTKTPTTRPTWQPTVFKTRAPTGLTAEEGGFSFAECKGGGGSFELQMDTPGATQMVGTLSAGLKDVRVSLSAVNDLDVVLYDTSETRVFSEGQALVAWCSVSKDPGCNIGLLSGKAEETVSYNFVDISYSGYNGVNGQKGDEFIRVAGVLPEDYSMGVLAFKAGSAYVEYSYAGIENSCCLGRAPCGGEFAQDIKLKDVVDVGIIPIGKVDLVVDLESREDVDIQLYDADDTSEFPEGKAIIAYCSPAELAAGCNKGILGNNKAEETVEYKGVTYTYSGYNGYDDKKGFEFVRVEGMTNTRLMMKAYGYKQGSASVSYEYYENV